LGASGDLAQRKLIPALNILFEQKKINKSNVVIGSGRSDFTYDSFRKKFKISSDFSKILFYHKGIKGLKSYLKEIGEYTEVVIFLSLPPHTYISTIQLSEEGFKENVSLIIEKPFGYDYKSAVELNEEISKYFDESQIFRIDHYLAKEAVQNILVFRFANILFDPIWNSRYVESIQINASETLALEGRAAYFDNSGMIRDMVQNHIMQLLCLMTMEPPISLNAEDIRIQKLNVLKALQIESCNRYQYEGYQQEDGVKDNTETETYAELKLHIDNYRWAGAPIYIRTGKATNRKGTEIGIRFKKLPNILFNEEGKVDQNQVIFKIQPSEGIILDLSSKIPGLDTLQSTDMKFSYREAFEQEIPEAYQTLLQDALEGDKTLFVGAEETELSWKKLDNILDKGETQLYRKGKQPLSNFDVDWIDFKKYEDK